MKLFAFVRLLHTVYYCVEFLFWKPDSGTVWRHTHANPDPFSGGDALTGINGHIQKGVVCRRDWDFFSLNTWLLEVKLLLKFPKQFAVWPPGKNTSVWRSCLNSSMEWRIIFMCTARADWESPGLHWHPRWTQQGSSWRQDHSQTPATEEEARHSYGGAGSKVTS